MRPKLTYGMATFDDYAGVWATVQSLRLYHAEAMPLVELLIVDNNPGSVQGHDTANLCNWLGFGCHSVRYIPFTKVTGTAAPRDLVFREASGEAVVCVDPHVMLPPGTLARLIRWYGEHPDCMDLIQGPMVYDNLFDRSTHMDDVWRAEMWGTWAKDARALPTEPEHSGRAVYQSEPFEITAMGLGLFSCRKEAWLGFNPKFSGFGGEEWYIHEKFRRAGRKCLCLPWLAWVHRFGPGDRVKYPLTRWCKVRNYVIGLSELGMDLAPVHKHFVEDNKFVTEEQWARLIANPADPPQMAEPEKPAGCGSCGNGRKYDGPPLTLNQTFDLLRNTKRDREKHADTIKRFASQAKSVTAFVKRHEWSVFLAAGGPEKLTVHQTEHGYPVEMADIKLSGMDASLSVEIEDTDLLVLDTEHNATRVMLELSKHADKCRRVMLSGTVFGETADGGQGPGMLVGLREYMRRKPEWSVVYHSQEQYGITVISRVPEDKPPLPGKLIMAVNYAKAFAKHAAKGLEHVAEEEHAARLEVCSTCEQRNGVRCAVCGCPVEDKALWKSEVCPLGKWS